MELALEQCTSYVLYPLYLSIYLVKYISSTQYIFSFILPYQVLYYLDDMDQMHLHSLRIHRLLQKSV